MRPLVLVLVGAALVSVLVGYLVVRTLPGPPTKGELAKIKAQGTQVVFKLERWHEEKSVYPEATEVVLPDAPYGGWRYERLPDRTYSLELGDYEEHGFTLWWVPHKQRWYVDA